MYALGIRSNQASEKTKEKTMENYNEIFLKLAAAYNCGEKTTNNVDIEDACFDDDFIVKTCEPQHNFGGKLEIEENGIKLFVLPDFQVQKGLRRGDLYTADFGDFRLVAFTGEGVVLK